MAGCLSWEGYAAAVAAGAAEAKDDEVGVMFV